MISKFQLLLQFFSGVGLLLALAVSVCIFFSIILLQNTNNKKKKTTTHRNNAFSTSVKQNTVNS